MHCGGCGRTIVGQLRRCLYCGGAPVEQEAKRERHLECPGCKGLMSETQDGDVLVDRCEACGGAWFDRAEIEHAIKMERSRKQELWDHLAPSEPKPEAKP